MVIRIFFLIEIFRYNCIKCKILEDVKKRIDEERKKEIDLIGGTKCFENFMPHIS